MNVGELHPEELLERDLRGALTPTERTRLEAHLEHCAVCRLERSARKDFAVAMEGDAAGIAEQALASAALAHASGRANRKVAVKSDATPARRIRLGAMLVAAALMVASAAIASRVTELVASPAEVKVKAPPLVERKALEAPAVQRAPSFATGVTPPRAIASAPEKQVDLALPTVAGAAELFSRASSARQSGDHTQASALYREIIDKHTGAPEIAPARLALARALESLHRDAEERAAWEALLAAYPQTIHAARAHARLGH